MTTSPAPSRLTARHWRTRRSAAVAGILFAVLLITAMVMMRLALADDSLQSLQTDAASRRLVRWSLHLVPFAGIAFLWFIGVVRDQLGDVEDRLFSTVFLGSGLLFLAMLFVGAAASTSVLELATRPSPDVEVWAFGRDSTQTLVSVYAMRMAAVFTLSVSTVGLRTRAIPPWVCLPRLRRGARAAGRCGGAPLEPDHLPGLGAGAERGHPAHQAPSATPSDGRAHRRSPRRRQAGLSATVQRAVPLASQGGSTDTPRASSWASTMRSERSIAAGLQPTQPLAVRVVEEAEQQHEHGDDHGDAADQRRLGQRPLAAVGEEEHEAEDDGADEVQPQPQRRRDDAGRRVHARVAGRPGGPSSAAATGRRPTARCWSSAPARRRS